MIKGIKDSPETVGAQGGMLGDGVVALSRNNLEWGGLDQKLKEWMKPETNLLERQSQRKDLVPMRISAKPWATN